MTFIQTGSGIAGVLAKADKAARSTARILITGETGTGKEMLARHIHAAGARAHKPFIAVNCASLSAELLESELFGHVRGAFTSALRAHDGLVRAADGGTLFLDEIGELAPALQAKLLRFVETAEFRKIGATAVERADVRIISATHRDLKRMAQQRRFREDLYFRLAVLTLALPPLRARQDDILPLAKHFIAALAVQENRAAPQLTADAEAALLAHDWPGNIRELQNTLHQALILHDGATLTAAQITTVAADAVLATLRAAARPQPLWLVQEAAIDAALQWCHGNIPRAAALLEVSPSTLYRRRVAPLQTTQTTEFEDSF
ncbi:MAG: sigma-54 dependent transcriptional regulator [Micavibrio sp.]|nr:sigma-54 dependent transcriptional regulator [Micavibrio sp.]